MPEYRQRIWQRFGLAAGSLPKQAVWVHAVSVGEVVAIVPVVKEILAARPEEMVIVTTMTPTGAERVQALLVNKFPGRVIHYYCPYDTPISVSCFLRQCRPKLLLIVETELWPNMIHFAHKINIPIVLANARLSEKSAKGYGIVANLAQDMLKKLSTVAVQNSRDGERFRRLGLPEQALSITGSIKFDIKVNESDRSTGENLRQQLGAQRKIIVAASTHDGEEEILLRVFQRIKESNAGACLLLVPRHPDRALGVLALIHQYDFKYSRRSKNEVLDETTDVLLVDTMGEMMAMFNAADVVFMGGSLVANGGHNFMEPAVLAKPIVSGLHVFNFQVIAEEMVDMGGLSLVSGEDALYTQLDLLLSSQEEAEHLGRSALAVVKKNQGAQQRLMTIINRHLVESSARN